MDIRFENQKYVIRRKIVTLIGDNFHIFDTNGQLLLFSRLKGFKLKEDIRLYTNEEMDEELLLIRARNIIDFSATYDVIDSKTEEKVGALKRKGLKSILKDEWLILDQNDSEIGSIKEDSMLLALIRRIITGLIPQKYHVMVNGTVVGLFKQNFNPFVIKLNVDLSADTKGLLDKRLALSAGILLCAIEGKQQ